MDPRHLLIRKRRHARKLEADAAFHLRRELAQSAFDLATSVKHSRTAEVVVVAGDITIPLTIPQLEAAGDYSGNMIGLMPTPEVAAELAKLGTEPEDKMHMTLIYIGSDPLSEQEKSHVREAVKATVVSFPDKLQLKTNGVGRFSHNDGVAYANVQCLGLAAFRTRLADEIEKRGMGYAKDYDFIPHMTLQYGIPLNKLPVVPELEWETDKVLVSFGGDDEFISMKTGDQKREAIRTEEGIRDKAERGEAFHPPGVKKGEEPGSAPMTHDGIVPKKPFPRRLQPEDVKVKDMH